MLSIPQLPAWASNEDDNLGKSLFVMDGFAGMSYGGNVSLGSEGVYWWSAAELASPSVHERDLAAWDVVMPGDITGDGVPDLALQGGGTTPEGARTTVVPGPLPAHLPQIDTHPAVQRFPYWLGTFFRCGDVSGDGQDDLCGTSGADFGPVDGVLDVTWSLSTDSYGTFAADFDGDGRQGVYQSDVWSITRQPDPAGTGGSDQTVVSPIPGGLFVLTVADLDADGQDELLLAGSEIRIFDEAGLASGTWQTMPIPADPLVRALAAGDFDGDGVLEIAVATVAPGGMPGVFPQPPNEVQIYEQDGTLRARIQADPPHQGSELGRNMAVGDIDGDGAHDLMLGGGSSDYGAAYFVPDPLCAPVPIVVP